MNEQWKTKVSKLVISIFPKLHQEEFSNKQHKVEAEVRTEPADKATNLKICEVQNGNFEVKFLVKVPGTYKIEVIINGGKLAHNPFTIQVKKRQILRRDLKA